MCSYTTILELSIVEYKLSSIEFSKIRNNVVDALHLGVTKDMIAHIVSSNHIGDVIMHSCGVRS